MIVEDQSLARRYCEITHMLLMEDGIDWSANCGTDVVKVNLDPKGEMFVALHALNSAAWEDPDGPTEQMVES